MKVEPHFRTITIRLILEILGNLVGDSIDIDLVDNIYFNFINNLKSLINNNKNIKEVAFELFEKEWKNYCKKNNDMIINEIISGPYLLIPFNLEDIVEGK